MEQLSWLHHRYKRVHLFIFFFILFSISLVVTLVQEKQIFLQHAATTTGGTIYYVSRNGSNLDGLSWASAWNELNKINWSLIHPGDTIVIDGGATACASNVNPDPTANPNWATTRPGVSCGMLYNTALTIGQSGTATAPITIQLATDPGHNGTAVLFGGRTTPLPYCTQTQSTYTPSYTGNSLSASIVIGNEQYIVLDGVKRSGFMIYGNDSRNDVVNSDGEGILFTNSSAAFITVRNMELFDNGVWYLRSDGTYNSDAPGIEPVGHNLTLERLLIHDNGQDDIQSPGPLTNITVQDSWLYMRRSNPLYPGYGFNEATHTVGCTHTDGIQVFGGNGGQTSQPSFTFANDLIGPLLSQGVYVSDTGVYYNNVTIQNTLFMDNVWNNVNVDPQTPNTNPINWVLQSDTFYSNPTAVDSNYQTNIGILSGSNLSVNNIIVKNAGTHFTPNPATGNNNIYFNISNPPPGGTNTNPLFTSVPSTTTPNYTDYQTADFTTTCSSCSAKGATITSFASILNRIDSLNQPASPTPPPTVTVSPTPVINIYSVSANRIVDQNGNAFMPYGLQIAGSAMADTSWNSANSYTQYITQTAMQQDHDFWHANTTRLQISSVNLFSGSAYPNYNSSYLTKIDQIVNYANQAGMNIILSLQYEGAGSTHYTLPVQDSINFWKVVAPHYTNNQRVFFDIFNEPLASPSGQTINNDTAWTWWQTGGVGNDGVTYVGMQPLVTAIRTSGANNLIFAEGLSAGEDIFKLPTHLLTGSNIVYALHPYFNNPNHVNDNQTLTWWQGQWDTFWGNTVNTLSVPVVADEWSQDQLRGGCILNAPQIVPGFLSYLQSHNVGLIGFAFLPGTLVKGNWSITTPSQYASQTTVCTPGANPNTDPTLEGAGQLVLTYFTSLASPTTPTVTPSPTQLPTPTSTNTPTPVTGFSFPHLFLHGIGTAGDNIFPSPAITPQLLSTLQTPTRPLTLQLFHDQTEQFPFATLSATVVYQPASGDFGGSVIWNTPTAGTYYVRVITPRYLQRFAPNAQTITLNQMTTIPPFGLVVGDVDGDNRLTIGDYNILLDCGDFGTNPLPMSDPTSKRFSTACQAHATQNVNVTNADLDDNGIINQFDITLLQREISVQPGQ